MFWYVATPYTKYPDGHEEAYKAACRESAWLIARGVPVFSPIAHTHGIAEQSSVSNTDGDYWLKADQPMMDAAYGIIVVKLPGWEESRGVLHEIEYFGKAGKPIVYLAHNAQELPPMLKEDCKPQEDLLIEAYAITHRSRNEDYGPPEEDLERTAKIWSVLFGRKFTGAEVAMAMITVKLSREVHRPKRDNALDMAGYAWCLDRCRAANVNS
jgi:hypothetical protein